MREATEALKESIRRDKTTIKKKCLQQSIKNRFTVAESNVCR